MPDLPHAAVIAATTPSTAPERVCVECGQSFRPNKPWQEFCSPAHNKAFQNRQLAQGQALVALAKVWRVSRNAKGQTPEAIAIRETGAKAFSELVSILDLHIAEDRAAGRPTLVPYVRRLLANGRRYIDRARRT